MRFRYFLAFLLLRLWQDNSHPIYPMALAKTVFSTKMLLLLVAALFMYFTCGVSSSQARQIIISVADQKLALVDKKGQTLAVWPVSTSKYGLGDRLGSYATPVGNLRIAEKIGAGAPLGAVFKSRKRTGEVLVPNAPGRDPVVTRILWLAGTETQNRRALSRCIYIHGTAEERNIGKPVSYGCIRMKSRDVTVLFNAIERGTSVRITPAKLQPEIRQVVAFAKGLPTTRIRQLSAVAYSRFSGNNRTRFFARAL